MIKWLWVLCLPLFAFSAIHSDHSDSKKVDEEFRNFELGLQPKQMKVFKSTPTLNELQDGEMVIQSTNAFNSLMFRSGDEIYSLKFSCITVLR